MIILGERTIDNGNSKAREDKGEREDNRPLILKSNSLIDFHN